MKYSHKTQKRAAKARKRLFGEYQSVRDYVDFVDVSYGDFLNWLGDIESKFSNDDGWLLLNEDLISSLIRKIY